MRLTTDIVLVGNEGRTQPYIIQLFPDKSMIGDFIFRKGSEFSSYQNVAYLFPKSSNKQLFRHENDWYNIDVTGREYTGIARSVIRIYFPQYSVDTFERKTKYILSLSTHIHGIQVQLGNFLFERKDALACIPARFGGMDEYYEYIDFNIADPRELLFSTATADIRSELGDNTELNNASSLLHVCLFAVETDGNGWIKKDNWTGGQNSILINDPEDLTLHAKYNPKTKNIDMRLTFNEDYQSLERYFADTYNCSTVACIVQYVVADSDNIYYEQSKSYDDIKDNPFTFSTEHEEGSVLDYRAYHPSFNASFSLAFDSNVIPYFCGTNFFDFHDSYKKGLNIQASIMFYDRSEGYDITEPFLTILSNKIFLTPELFAIMVNTNRGVGNDLIPSFINLEDLDMNNINLKATNKIIQEVHVVSPTDSTKNHLIQPIFYQVRDIDNSIIHPAVTENIAINLDSYKSVVSRFKIQIEGVTFNEVGRTSKGVVFKVVGNMLPKENDKGLLYILNQDNDLVTTGKYTYLF